MQVGVEGLLSRFLIRESDPRSAAGHSCRRVFVPRIACSRVLLSRQGLRMDGVRGKRHELRESGRGNSR